MTFKKAPLCENFPISHWVSTGGQWEIGLYPMIFGVRVRCGRVGAGYVALDLCAGADPKFQLELLRCVMIVLIPVSEDILEAAMQAIFPRCDRKPINTDPCWPKIQEMAMEVLRRHDGLRETNANRKLVEITPDAQP